MSQTTRIIFLIIREHVAKLVKKLKHHIIKAKIIPNLIKYSPQTEKNRKREYIQIYKNNSNE